MDLTPLCTTPLPLGAKSVHWVGKNRDSLHHTKEVNRNLFILGSLVRGMLWPPGTHSRNSVKLLRGRMNPLLGTRSAVCYLRRANNSDWGSSSPSVRARKWRRSQVLLTLIAKAQSLSKKNVKVKIYLMFLSNFVKRINLLQPTKLLHLKTV